MTIWKTYNLTWSDLAVGANKIVERVKFNILYDRNNYRTDLMYLGSSRLDSRRKFNDASFELYVLSGTVNVVVSYHRICTLKTLPYPEYSNLAMFC